MILTMNDYNFRAADPLRRFQQAFFRMQAAHHGRAKLVGDLLCQQKVL